MTNETTTERHALPTCPDWCVTDHLPEKVARGGYFHDGAPEALPFAEGTVSASLSDCFDVFPSQHVADDDERTVYAAHVEIHDGNAMVARMAPVDARQLGAMLVRAADLAES